MRASTLETILVLYARHFPIRRGKMRVIDALWHAAARGADTRRLATLKHGGFIVPCDLNEMIQRQLYFFGTYFVEEYILDCWAKEAIGAKIIFDVGANVGIFSLVALAVQASATVHAFEPTPEIAAGLRETAALNTLDQLRVHEMAVSNETGHAALRRYRGDTGQNGGMNFITTAVNDPHAELVQTVRLDHFCAENAIEQIDLLKLDIQGNEHRALAGAERMLCEGRVGTVITELNWTPDAGSTCPALESIRILEQAGYAFSKLGKELHWARSGDWLRPLSDVIARRIDFD